VRSGLARFSPSERSERWGESGGSKGRGVALANALAEFEAVLNPAAEHRIEEERSQRVIATETGLELFGLEEDPKPGLDHG